MSDNQRKSGYLLHTRGRQHHWHGSGLLSIKTFRNGQAHYKVGNAYYAVDDTSYLVLNHEQPYTITVDSVTPIESFCVFFEPGLAEEVYRSLTTNSSKLLDEPQRHIVTTLHFFERIYQHDTLLSPALHNLRLEHSLRNQEQIWLEEQLYGLMQYLLYVHQSIYKEIDSLSAVRAATREELYRRIYKARDYAAALFDTAITLDDMANVANLSPNHFLRTFKQIFQQTPHQFIISKRLERAQQLLLTTDHSVTDICFIVGFNSLGSFSWLFRQRIGISPEGYRHQKGDF